MPPGGRPSRGEPSGVRVRDGSRSARAGDPGDDPRAAPSSATSPDQPQRPVERVVVERALRRAPRERGIA